MRRPGILAVVVATLVASLAIAGRSDEPPAEALAISSFDVRTPGPLGPITIFGDSVMLGSGLYSPTLPDQLVARGWGPVRFLAGAGFNTGRPFRAPADARITTWIERWRSEGWATGPWVVNLGANDSAFCGPRDAGCMRAAIEHVLNALGPDTPVWWPQMTLQAGRAVEQATWNATLAELAGARDDFATWDWPTEMRLGGYASSDGIHLSPSGYRTRSARMATEITAELARGRRTGGDAPLPTAAGEAASYRPLPLQRIVDTREGGAPRRPGGSTLRVDLDGLVPDGTTAVVTNVTAAAPATNGHLRADPCGTSGTGSTVNYTPGGGRAAMTITPLGDGDDICITTSSPTHVVVDLQGAFVAGTEGLLLQTLPTPTRLLDTRETGRARRLRVDAPEGAEAVALGLTAAGAAGIGWVRAYPCGAPPTTPVSNVNFRPGEAIAGSAYVPVAADGTVCIDVERPVDVIVDLTAVFRADAGLAFVPAAPSRMIDSRDRTGGWYPIHGAGQTFDVRVAPSGARAVTGTITLVRPLRRSHLTAWSCAGDPPTSSVNALPGLVLAASVTTAVSSSGRLCIAADQAGQTLFDTTGWWIE